jgi:hypothetical protein
LFGRGLRSTRKLGRPAELRYEAPNPAEVALGRSAQYPNNTPSLARSSAITSSGQPPSGSAWCAHEAARARSRRNSYLERVSLRLMRQRQTNAKPDFALYMFELSTSAGRRPAWSRPACGSSVSRTKSPASGTKAVLTRIPSPQVAVLGPDPGNEVCEVVPSLGRTQDDGTLPVPGPSPQNRPHKGSPASPRPKES